MKIQLNNVSKAFYNKKFKINALNNFNLSLDIENCIYAYVGPNGAGKTTLFKILSGLLFPDSGELLFDVKCDRKQWIKENISYIMSGDKNFYFGNTVMENAMYYCVLKGIKPDVAKENILKNAKLLGCEDYLERRMESLSSGERKKSAILSGISVQSKILLIDEPTWGLDIDAVISLQKFLVNLQKKNNTCIMISSHDVYFMTDITDKYIFINNGECKKVINSNMDSSELTYLYEKLCGRNNENNNNILV